MSEVGVEIIKTEETKESEVKYLNINVSNSEVERDPDVVRLCADTGILEYVKPKSRKFIEIIVDYPPAESCIYPEYKGKPYFSIKYEENGEEHIGYGTYNPKVLSRYLQEYFIAPTIIETDNVESEN